MGAEGGEEAGGDIRLGANAQAFDLCDWEDVAGGGSHENGAGPFQICGEEVAFADGNAGDVDRIEEDFAGDAGEATGIERWGDDFVTEDGEEVGGGALADAAVFVEEDDFVEAAFVGLFVPGEIIGPGGDFGAAKLVGALAGVGLDGQADGIAPVPEAGGEGDDVELAGLAGGFKQATVVADDGDAEGAIGSAVGGDEAVEAIEQGFGRFRQRYAHSVGIAHHAGPVAIPFKQNAFGDAEGTKNAPSIEESNLAGEQAGLRGFADRLIVEQ